MPERMELSALPTGTKGALKDHARQRGMTVAAWIWQAVEEKAAREKLELPGERRRWGVRKDYEDRG